MNVEQAVALRFSARAFLDEPVPRDLLEDLLGMAARAPSGGNLQPWTVHVVTGEAQREITRRVQAVITAGTRETPEYAVYPSPIWEPYRQRRRAAGARRFEAMGAADKDPAAQREMLMRNAAFFGAPVGLFFCLDRRFSAAQWSDLGMYMQTLMLLAKGRGLDSCPQEVWSNWPVTVGDCLRMPDNQMLFAGMALGYSDPDSAWNGYRTERAGLDAFVRWHD